MRATVLVFALALLLPAASAHTSETTSDGKYILTVGNLNEPVYTFVPTGLDLIIRENTEARDPVAAAEHEPMEATLIAPDGSRLTDGLKAQFGNPGHYTFDKGYTLTQPGEYHLEITGSLFGTALDHTILVGSGPLTDQGDNYFPDQDVPSLLDLDTRLTALQDHMDAMMMQDLAGDEDSPGLGLLLAGIALVGAALVYNRR